MSFDIYTKLENELFEKLNNNMPPKIEIPKTSKTLLKMEADWNEHGVIIHYQSEAIERWMQHVSKRGGTLSSNNVGWKGKQGYQIPQGFDMGDPKISYFRSWGGPLFFNGNNTPNLSPLCAVGLSKGVSFEFQGLYTPDTVQKYIKETKAIVLDLLKDYFRKFDVADNVSMQEAFEVKFKPKLSEAEKEARRMQRKAERLAAKKVY